MISPNIDNDPHDAGFTAPPAGIGDRTNTGRAAPSQESGPDSISTDNSITSWTPGVEAKKDECGFPQWIIDDLQRSGISPDRARELGMEPVSRDRYFEILGFEGNRCSAGYTIPFRHPVTGNPMLTPDKRPFVRIRLKEEASWVKDGVSVSAKYFSPQGGGQHVYILQEVHDAILQQDKVFVMTEGEKKSIAGTEAGIPMMGLTGNFGWVGLDKDLLPELIPYAEHASACVVIWDSDAAGNEQFNKSTDRLASALSKHHCELRQVILPELGGVKTGVDDYLLHPEGGAAELRVLIGQAHPVTSVNQSGGSKPAVFLPGGNRTILGAGRELGELMAENHTVFTRGGAIVKLDKNLFGQRILANITPSQMCSRFEEVASLFKEGKNQPSPSICHESTAKLIMDSEPFSKALPTITAVHECPVLIERAGKLVTIADYDRVSGILAKNTDVEDVAIEEAVPLLKGLIADFQFASDSDRSRALASIITPALVFGGLLRGRVPVDLTDADDSQAGKGYRNKVTAAIYGQSVQTVTHKKGVGNLEESFDAIVAQGYGFIGLDNVRGHFESQAIESFMTEDSYVARTPYSKNTFIDTRKTIVMFTANGAKLNVDMANRCSVVKIHKRPNGFEFRTYVEGDLLDHVRKNRGRYLGAVFAVIRAWHEAGKETIRETRHSFREWAGCLGWIIENVLDEPPLLDGYEEKKRLMTTQSGAALRDVVLAVCRAGAEGEWLRTSAILDLLQDDGRTAEEWGLRSGATGGDQRKNMLQALGRLLGGVFSKEAKVEVEGVTIERRKEHDKQSRKDVWEYRVHRAPEEKGPVPAIGADADSIGAEPPPPASIHPCTTTSGAVSTEWSQGCAYGAPEAAPKAAPKENGTAPNAPIDLGPLKAFDNSGSDGVADPMDSNCTTPLGALGALGALTAPEEGEFEGGSCETGNDLDWEDAS